MSPRRSCGPCWWNWDSVMERWKGPVRGTFTISLWRLHGRWLMLPAPRNHLQSPQVVLPSLAPFATNIAQPSFSSPVATWCAGIANVASSFANVLCVVDPSLQPAMDSSWIEGPDLAVLLLVGEDPRDGSCKLDCCGPVL